MERHTGGPPTIGFQPDCRGICHIHEGVRSHAKRDEFDHVRHHRNVETVAFTVAKILWGYDFYVDKDAQVQQLVSKLTLHLETTGNIWYTCKSDAHWGQCD